LQKDIYIQPGKEKPSRSHPISGEGLTGGKNGGMTEMKKGILQNASVRKKSDIDQIQRRYRRDYLEINFEKIQGGLRGRRGCGTFWARLGQGTM